jgi:hypothetical protein
MVLKHGEHLVLAPADDSLLLNPNQEAQIKNLLAEIEEQEKAMYSALDIVGAKHQQIKNILVRAARVATKGDA